MQSHPQAWSLDQAWSHKVAWSLKASMFKITHESEGESLL